MSTIVIDPSHGGSTRIAGSSPNNAKGPKGTLEKNLTLELGLLVASKLSRNHTCILTRSTDVNIGLKGRAEIAKENRADVFVSIHFNGDIDQNTQGTETWIDRNASGASNLLAKSIQNRLISVTKYKNRGIKSDQDLGVLRPQYHFFSTAICLLEISFLTDPRDEERLKSSAYKDSIADAISKGIIDYISQHSKGIVKKLLVSNLKTKASNAVMSISMHDAVFINNLMTHKSDRLFKQIADVYMTGDSAKKIREEYYEVSREEYEDFIDYLIDAIERRDIEMEDGGSGGDDVEEEVEEDYGEDR